MSGARRQRWTRRWGRYVNHYGHIPNIIIGGSDAIRAMNYGRVRGEYYYVRRQQTHAFMRGYAKAAA